MLRVSSLLILLIFTLAGVLLASEASSQNKITLQVQDATLQEVLEAIEAQTNLMFSYPASLQNIHPLSVAVNDELLDTVLSEIEEQAQVKFNRVGNMIAVTRAHGQASGSNSRLQRSSINGYVVDEQTGETLIGANIALMEINRGTSSNTSGYYTITNVPPGSYTLVCSYIGYEQFEREVILEADENLRLNIELQAEGLYLEEIVVESERERERQKDIGRTQITTQLIKELPSVLQPDVFRSVQLLPGVKAASDFSSGLYIRGGSPDQTLILLDETTVYNPSHFFGLFSTFNPDAVKNVQLYKGGYPAEYGGRIGSVLTVFNKDGNRNEMAGTVSLGMLASRASIEGPYKYGSYMFSVRRSTIEPLLSQIDDAPDTFYFYDVNGKLNFDASENDRFSVAFYSGTDALAWEILDEAFLDLNYGNQTLSAQWKKIFSDRLFSTFTATGSRYFNKPEFQISGTSFETQNNIYDYSLKGDIEYIPNEHHTLSAGFWGGDITLRYKEVFDRENTFDRKLHSQYLSVYLQERWSPADNWIATGGVRLNMFSEGEYARLEPRLSVEYRPAETIRLQTGYGRYNQFLTLITNEAFSGFDTWLTAAENVPPAWGDQFLLGAKTIPFSGYGFDIELYYRTMNDLFELDPFVGDDAGLDYEEQFRFGEGYAYGVEAFLEKQTGRLTGFIGYTYGVTRRKFPGFNADLLDNPDRARFYPPKYDRTHDVNVVTSYSLSRRWSISAVFNYSTGQAYTEPLGRTQFSNMPWGSYEREAFVVGKLNASRLPPYHRLDLSFSRAGTFFGLGNAEWQFQAINVYNRRNVWFYNYDFDINPVKREDIYMLPVLPVVSYTVNF